MTRLGITYNDVMDAIIKIVKKKETPTVEKVRAILGTGSSGTICKHMQKWRLENKIVFGNKNLPKSLQKNQDFNRGFNLALDVMRKWIDDNQK